MNKRRIESEEVFDDEIEKYETKKQKKLNDNLSRLTKWTIIDGEGKMIPVRISPAFCNDIPKFEENTSLLERPISELFRSIEEKERIELHNQLKQNKSVNQSASKDQKLWVEKYKPNSYTDLLSDEVIKSIQKKKNPVFCKNLTSPIQN